MGILKNLFVTTLSLATAVQGYSPCIAKSINAKRSVQDDPKFPAYSLSVPVDHFHNESMYEPHSNETFKLHYWINAEHYKPGGPVIMIAGGEAGGDGRIPFLQDGIGGILAKATNGLGVVLEHRYYGKSWPTKDLSTESLRFLTTDQALADTAYFAQHVVFKGLEKYNLTAPNTPWILYGGSYAGGFCALAKVKYPETFWGAISSSGITKAMVNFPQFYEPMRLYAPPECIKTDQKLVNILDNIMIGKNDSKLTRRLKTLFGVADLSHDDDFAIMVANGIASWENQVWDPAQNDPQFVSFCGNITSTKLLYPETERLSNEAKDLISIGGWAKEQDSLITPLLNLVGYLNLTSVSVCHQEGKGIEECLGHYDEKCYQHDDIDQTWRSWPYQKCTQWGYWQVGSTWPQDQLPLISRTIDFSSQNFVCRTAFNLTTDPDVEAINKYGGFDIEADRLAFISGEWDSWRWASPQAPEARWRNSTLNKPFIVIPKSIHHWDEYGKYLKDFAPGIPPKQVIDTQYEEVVFVNHWMKEWNKKSNQTQAN